MSKHRSQVFAARWVIPVSQPPIHGGWVRTEGTTITEVGAGAPPANSQDLGDVAILPGLVNAHTHLEFSAIDEPIGDPGIPLAHWIGHVVRSRGEITLEEKADAICRGLIELGETGTCLAGEIMTPPCSYVQSEHQPELVTFAEVLGLGSSRAAERLSAAEHHLMGSERAAVSPHAPYSTARETIEAAVTLAQRFGRPLAMHVAESPDERELLIHGSGPFAETLQALGVWRKELFPWGPDPVCDLIDRLARAPSALLVHGNDLNAGEIETLRKHANLSVVYCPRTHHFFRYPTHPVAKLLGAGVNVALGTDSRASNPDLNLWREVQFLFNHRTDLEPSQVIEMATLNGARALGHARLGSIQKDRIAHLGVVATSASNASGLYEDLSANDYQPIIRDTSDGK